MIRILKQNSFAGIVLTILFVALVFVSSWMAGTEPAASSPSSYFSTFLEELLFPVPLLSMGIAFVVVCTLAVLVNYAVIQLNLLPRPSYLPGFLWALLYLGDPANIFVNENLLASILIFLLVLLVNPGIDGQSRLMDVFNTGLITGLLSIVYLPCITMLVFIWIAPVFFAPFNFRKVVVTTLGFLLSWLYGFTYLYWFDELEFYFHPEDWFAYGLPGWAAVSNVTYTHWIFVGSVAIMSLWAIMRVQVNYMKLKLLQRRRYSLLISMMLFLLLSGMHQLTEWPSHLHLLVLPLAVFWSGAIFFLRRWWIADLLVFSLIVLLLSAQWVRHFA